MTTEPTDLADFSAALLVRAYRRGQVSPVEAIRAVLDRMDDVDPAVNAICWRDDEASLEVAARLRRVGARASLRARSTAFRRPSRIFS